MDQQKPVNYGSMFGGGNADTVVDTPTETIEDLVDIEVSTNNEFSEIENAVEAVVESMNDVDVTVDISEEPVVEETFIRVTIDPVAKLRLRDVPSIDGVILGSLVNDTVLRVINSDNSDWALVETEIGGEVVRGYVKLAYTVAMSVPNE
jgi:hypothetical protein